MRFYDPFSYLWVNEWTVTWEKARGFSGQRTNAQAMWPNEWLQDERKKAVNERTNKHPPIERANVSHADGNGPIAWQTIRKQMLANLATPKMEYSSDRGCREQRKMLCRSLLGLRHSQFFARPLMSFRRKIMTARNISAIYSRLSIKLWWPTQNENFCLVWVFRVVVWAE